MLKRILKIKTFVLIFLILALFSSVAPAWYPYRRGRWYRGRDWFWFRVGAPAIVIGSIVTTLPPNYSIVFIGNMPYYYYDDIYYRPYSSGGYIVVPAPTVSPVFVTAPPETTAVTDTTHVSPSAAAQQNTFTVNIPDPNVKGEYIAVILKKVKNGFIGPQGELYKEFPSVEQLQVMYASKKHNN